ncbi:hypothetical protein D3C85_1638470 [compost metagenome]
MAARALDAANTSKMPTNRRLRSKRAAQAVRNGPKQATVKANRVTSKPAWDTLTSRSRAMPGSRPTMTNSVVSTVKPAAASNKIGSNIYTPQLNKKRPGPFAKGAHTTRPPYRLTQRNH